MPVSFVRLPRTLIAMISGPITLDQLEAYLPVFADATDDAVLVDLATAQGLDAASLGAISALADRLTALGRSLHIAAPSKTTQALLEDAELHNRATILTKSVCQTV